MTSLLIKFLSWWIPERRYSMWHCSFLELLIAAWLFLFLPALTSPLLDYIIPEGQIQTDNQDTLIQSVVNKNNDNSHPVVRMVQTRNWTFIALGFYMACILAPINEEALFRAGVQNCLQGFLTKFLYKKRPFKSVKTSRWAIAITSIFLPALFFALIHFRSAEAANRSIDEVVRNVVNLCIAWTLFPILCFTYLFIVRRLRFRDVFGTRREIPGLIANGIKWIWIIVPVYLLAIFITIVQFICRTNIVADPIGLLPLALVFGFLYYRTQSIVPSIALHFLFNFSSLCMVLPFVL